MQLKVKPEKCADAIFLDGPQTVATAGVASMHNARVLDWPALRGELRRLRAENDLTREELQKLSGVEKTTIYRIENTKEMPDYKPDFDTVSALLVAMEITLSAFFARIEGVAAPASNESEPLPAVAELAAALDRLITARVNAPVKGTTVLTIPVELDEAEQKLIIETAVDVAQGRPSARTESPRPRRPATSLKRQKQA